ncbi:uncharacterized protein TNIN_94741 [Trichonephila inaurata madagascariensis]|uniref:Uncharacterized protein n=1 Tax=Trichonephila inaurata madagascariensis TaxID=2747483 RepID=A0A8X6YGG7_9ARAC|nr:uncharacterized protein TNIN_94741 [Trichonephila inaurata madagascariensis]
MQDTNFFRSAILFAINQIDASLQGTEQNLPPPLEVDDTLGSSNFSSDNLQVPHSEQFLMEEAIVVSSLVSTLMETHMRNPLSYEKILQQQFLVNRKYHASVLFAVLKFNGIACAQATFYYQGIENAFPTISWKLYVMLCFYCEWSEYFVESAVQLESDILTTVLKSILKTEWRDERLKYYSWHMVLQAIIKKFFIIEDPRLSYSKYSITFKYPFVDSNAMPQTGSQELPDDFSQSPLFNVYKRLLRHLFSFSLCSAGNVWYNKIILHAYKTIFKMLRRLKTSEKNVVRELFVLNTLLKQCCFEKEFKEAIKSFKKENSFLMHYYTTASWKIPGEYLLFILCNYWNETLKILSEKDNTPLSSLAECFPSNEERNCLINICSLYSDQFEENDFYTKALKCIIICNYPCATNAALVILRQPKLREKEEILQVLERKPSIFKAVMIYQKLIDVIVETESKETRIRFLKILHLVLYHCARKYTTSLYNDVLKYMCQKYDMKNHFKFDNFDYKLAAFSQKKSYKEIKKCLIPLFIQSPTIVLKTVIKQALMNGSEGMNGIGTLQFVPMACLYRNSLVKELEYYFSKEKLRIYERKNLSKLIRSLMKIQVFFKPLLNLDEFFQKCFIKNNLIHINRLLINYECLAVALKVLTDRNALNISSEVYRHLVDKIFSFISKSIQLKHGRAKEVAIATLPLLEKYEERGLGLIQGTHELGFNFGLNPFSSILHVYASQLSRGKSYKDIPGASDELCGSLWTWCCHFKDASLFQKVTSKERVRYASLMDVIYTVLPHFTKEEWFETARLLKEYFKFANPAVVQSSTQVVLPQTDRKQYAVIRSLMDCYTYIIPGDQHYLAACFTNTVMNLLNEKASPELYLNVFVDTCYLISVNNTLTLHLPFLSSIKREIYKKLKQKRSKYSKQFYNNMMYHGLKDHLFKGKFNSIQQQNNFIDKFFSEDSEKKSSHFFKKKRNT